MHWTSKIINPRNHSFIHSVPHQYINNFLAMSSEGNETETVIIGIADMAISNDIEEKKQEDVDDTNDMQVDQKDTATFDMSMVSALSETETDTMLIGRLHRLVAWWKADDGSEVEILGRIHSFFNKPLYPDPDPVGIDSEEELTTVCHDHLVYLRDLETLLQHRGLMNEELSGMLKWLRSLVISGYSIVTSLARMANIASFA